MLNENSYSDSSKNTFIWNERFSFHIFFHHPLHFLNFLLTFKLVDVLVYIFGQSKLATDEMMAQISLFPSKIFLICGVFVTK